MADCLNRIGLILGLISGLLLTPEVVNRIPVDRLEQALENWLSKLEIWLKFPLRFHPLSWKIIFSEKQREAIEPITAISGLIFSIIWISTLVSGIVLSSRFFVILSLMTLVIITLRQLRVFHTKGFPLNAANFTKYFFIGFILLSTITPILSLVRVILMILRALAKRVRKLFNTHEVLRVSLTTFAILTFIISNLLQLIATYFE